VLDLYLGGEDWEEPPEAMAFEASYGSIIEELSEIVPRLRKAGGEGFDGAESLALRAYTRAPALVNVALNYKICVEHGLPLHPTVYYELTEARRYNLVHPIAEIESSNRIFRSSIEVARAVYRLDPGYEEISAAFRATLPGEISSFVYTSGADKYTWRASEPEKLCSLAAKVRGGFSPQLLLAAAHGSIMPALLLAEYLGLPLYFIRFSVFKRHDEAPIVSLSDEAWLSSWREGRVLIYDEDVAKGRTLSEFATRLGPLFTEYRTACSIRHAGASVRPDFASRVWWD
jgi:hypothetical protein